MDKNKNPKKFDISDLLNSAALDSDFEPTIDPSAKQPAAEPTKSGMVDGVVPGVSTEAPQAAVDSGNGSARGGKAVVRAVAQKRSVWITALIVGVGLLIMVGIQIGFRFMNKAPQAVESDANIDKATLLVDSNKKTVGVKTGAEPDGLEVGATVTATNQGTANVRIGLINGTDPSILLEDSKANSWQILGANGVFEIFQGTDSRFKLDSNALTLTNSLNVKGNTTLGENGNALLTIQGNKIATPNSLSIDDNTLALNAGANTVAVGMVAGTAFKLQVAGTFKANGSIFTDGQVLAAAGSARGPSFAFSGNTNSGVFQPAINAVGISTGGTETLRIQPGAVIAIGANLETDSYVRAGRAGSNPPFQVSRYTGSLDGSGSAVIGTGIGTLYARALSVEAFYRGNNNEAISMNVDYVNGGNIQVSGGIPGRQFRVTLIYSQDNAGW